MAIPGLGFTIPSGAGVATLVIWLFVFIIIGVTLGVILLMVLVGKDQKKVVEIDMSSKRMKIFNGRLKKNKKSNIKQFWAGKIKRFLPRISGTSTFIKGKKDAYILLKDKNEMYHSVKIPTYKEIKKWYKVQYDVDLDNTKDLTQEQERTREIYLLPTPHEDLDWLSSQVLEADREFKVEHWWQSPTLAYIGVGFICFMTWVATLVIAKKM